MAMCATVLHVLLNVWIHLAATALCLLAGFANGDPVLFILAMIFALLAFVGWCAGKGGT